MEVLKDISYGVIPVYKEDDMWSVLLVHQISYRGDNFWILPKGHAESGETPVQAAMRELVEETGVDEVALDKDFLATIEYSFIHENTRIEKVVEYYLGYCSNQDVCVSQPHEIKELRWCSFTEAALLVTHDNSREVLIKANRALQ